MVDHADAYVFPNGVKSWLLFLGRSLPSFDGGLLNQGVLVQGVFDFDSVWIFGERFVQVVSGGAILLGVGTDLVQALLPPALPDSSIYAMAHDYPHQSIHAWQFRPRQHSIALINDDRSALPRDSFAVGSSKGGALLPLGASEETKGVQVLRRRWCSTVSRLRAAPKPEIFYATVPAAEHDMASAWEISFWRSEEM